MVDYETFEKAIISLQTWSDMTDELYNKFSIDIIESPINNVVSDLVRVLGYSLSTDGEFGYDTLGWWCWECNFGRTDDLDLITIVNDDGKSTYIDTIEKLYGLLTGDEKIWK